MNNEKRIYILFLTLFRTYNYYGFTEVSIKLATGRIVEL